MTRPSGAPAPALCLSALLLAAVGSCPDVLSRLTCRGTRRHPVLMKRALTFLEKTAQRVTRNTGPTMRIHPEEGIQPMDFCHVEFLPANLLENDLT